MKIALYKRTCAGWKSPLEVDAHIEDDPRWLRVSEIVEVEFTSIENVQKEVAALNLQREKQISEHMDALAKIDEQISKLMTHEEVA